MDVLNLAQRRKNFSHFVKKPGQSKVDVGRAFILYLYQIESFSFSFLHRKEPLYDSQRQPPHGYSRLFPHGIRRETAPAQTPIIPYTQKLPPSRHLAGV